MDRSRRDVICATAGGSIVAVAGCLDVPSFGAAEIDVTHAEMRPDEDDPDGPVQATFEIETSEAPIDVEIEVTTFDADGDVVDEFVYEATLESESGIVTFEVDTPEFERFEYTVREG